MNEKRKALLNFFQDLGDWDLWIADAELVYKLHNLSIEFVSRLRSAFGRQETCDALFLEDMKNLVVSRTRKAVKSCGLADREFVVTDTAKHLVFELKKIYRIEEVVIEEAGGMNLIGMSVEQALFLENGLFGGEFHDGVNRVYKELCRIWIRCQLDKVV